MFDLVQLRILPLNIIPTIFDLDNLTPQRSAQWTRLFKYIRDTARVSSVKSLLLELIFKECTKSLI